MEFHSATTVGAFTSAKVTAITLAFSHALRDVLDKTSPRVLKSTLWQQNESFHLFKCQLETFFTCTYGILYSKNRMKNINFKHHCKFFIKIFAAIPCNSDIKKSIQLFAKLPQLSESFLAQHGCRPQWVACPLGHRTTF